MSRKGGGTSVVFRESLLEALLENVCAAKSSSVLVAGDQWFPAD
jgi:hypothetical protein